MPQLNDCRYDALIAQGFSGATNDMLLAWAQAGGATSNQLNDALLEYLKLNGGVSNTLNDVWYESLISAGYLGARNDMEKDFWCDGGIPAPNATVVAAYPLTSTLESTVDGVQVFANFTRAAGASSVEDFEGSVIPCLDGEARFWRARRVENLATGTDAPITQSIAAVIGASYIVSCAAGDLTVSDAFTGSIVGGGEIVPTVATTATLTLTITTATNIQVEQTTGTQLLASEYVNNGVIPTPWHGANVDGVQYFATDRSAAALPNLSGVLVESVGTNTHTNSGDVGGTDWTNTNLTAVIVPDSPAGGSSNRLVGDAASSGKFIVQDTSITTGITYTQSMYAKFEAGGLPYIQIAGSTGFDGSAYANFNIETGTLGTVINLTAAIQSVGNGWYRCSVNAVANLTTPGRMLIGPRPNDGIRNEAWLGDGVIGALFWGAQLETGNLSTYVPTVATPVTRADESLIAPSPLALQSATTNDVRMTATWEQPNSNASPNDQYITETQGLDSNNRLGMTLSPANDLFAFKVAAGALITLNQGSGLDVPASRRTGIEMTLSSGFTSRLNGTPVNDPDIASVDLSGGTATFSIGCRTDGLNQLNAGIKNVVIAAIAP